MIAISIPLEDRVVLGHRDHDVAGHADPDAGDLGPDLAQDTVEALEQCGRLLVVVGREAGAQDHHLDPAVLRHQLAGLVGLGLGVAQLGAELVGGVVALGRGLVVEVDVERVGLELGPLDLLAQGVARVLEVVERRVQPAVVPGELAGDALVEGDARHQAGAEPGGAVAQGAGRLRPARGVGALDHQHHGADGPGPLLDPAELADRGRRRRQEVREVGLDREGRGRDRGGRGDDDRRRDDHLVPADEAGGVTERRRSRGAGAAAFHGAHSTGPGARRNIPEVPGSCAIPRQGRSLDTPGVGR